MRRATFSLVSLAGLLAVTGLPTTPAAEAATLQPPAAAAVAPEPVVLPLPGGSGTCARYVTNSGAALGWDAASGRWFRWKVGGSPSFLQSGLGVIDVNAEATALIGGSGTVALWRADGTLTDITQAVPAGFNARVLGRTIVGGTFPSTGTTRFGIWSPTGGFVDLGTGGGTNVQIKDANELDQLVGHRTTAQGFERGFLWSAPTGVVQLGTIFGSNSHVTPLVINDLGEVAGEAGTNGSPNVRAFRWSLSTPMVGGPTGTQTRPTAITNTGLVVGTSPGQFVPSGFRWKGATFVVQQYSGPPAAANTHGQVVGYATSGAWAADDVTFTDLGDYPSYATDINDRGVVSGCIPDPASPDLSLAVIWTVDTPTQVHWSATEYARIQQLMTHYGMDYDELTKFGVYVAAFINGIDPSPVPTPITVAPPGTAQTQTITWHPDEIALLETVKQRWVLDDEGAHRWGFMLLSFIATLQGA